MSCTKKMIQSEIGGGIIILIEFLENYLLNTSGDIINIFYQFCKQSNWTKERANKTFTEVFYHSEKVTW